MKKKGAFEELSTPQIPSSRDNGPLPIVPEIENNNNNDNNGEMEESGGESNNEERQNFEDDYPISPELDPSVPAEEEGEDVEVKEEISLPDPIIDVEEITQRTSSDSAPTPIGTNEILKLEDDVAKTIENDNNVGDVPPPPKQPDDKILEEWAQNVFSRPPSEEATLSSETQSTSISTSTETYRQNLQHETTVKEVTEEKHQEIQLSTADIEEIVKETLASTIAGMASTTTINALSESETIFTPINNTHNEHINVFIDEKLPIVTSTTMELPLTSSIAIERESILVSLSICVMGRANFIDSCWTFQCTLYTKSCYYY